MRQWYAGESLCTPSRAASMTGRLPLRTGMIPPPGSGARVSSTESSGGLPLDETTLGEMLGAAGYHTGIVGKWHLGINRNTSTDGYWLPKRRGFDHSGLTLPFSNHWNCDENKRHVAAPDAKRCLLYKNDTLVQQPIDHSSLTENLAADAVAFLREAAAAQHTGGADAKPFFLYFGFPQCHVSMFNNINWANSSRNGVFGSNIREVGGKRLSEEERRRRRQGRGEACGAEGAGEADAGEEGGAHLNGCRHGEQHVQQSSCGG